jgi:hypothetical protein
LDIHRVSCKSVHLRYDSENILRNDVKRKPDNVSYAERRAQWSEEFHKKDFTVSGKIIGPKEPGEVPFELPPIKGTWSSDLALKLMAIDRVNKIFKKEREEFLQSVKKRPIKAIEEDLRKVPSTLSVHQGAEDKDGEPPFKQIRLDTRANPTDNINYSPTTASAITSPFERNFPTGVDLSRDPRLQSASSRGFGLNSIEGLGIAMPGIDLPNNESSGEVTEAGGEMTRTSESIAKAANAITPQTAPTGTPTAQRSPFHNSPIITTPRAAIEAAAQKLAQGATTETQAAIKALAPQLIRRVSNYPRAFPNHTAQAPANTNEPESLQPMVQRRGGATGSMVDKARDPRRRSLPFLSTSHSPPPEPGAQLGGEQPTEGSKVQNAGGIEADNEEIPMDMASPSPARAAKKSAIVPQNSLAPGQMVDAARDPRRRPPKVK